MSKKSDNRMKAWWHTPLGRHVMHGEQQALAALDGRFFGYFQLQIGGGEKILPACGRPVSQSLVSADGDVEAHAESLPFKSHSIDNLLLLHVLETASDPHQVLRESERILAADGTLMLCSFNPVSLWGMQRLLSWQDAPPWDGHFFSQTRIRDWLALLNFEVQYQQRLLFRPPLHNERWLEACRFADRWGRRLWPWFGGVTLLVATKRTIPLTPVRQAWRGRRLFPGTPLVNKPITRNAKHG